MAEKFTKRSHIHPVLRIVLLIILMMCGGMLFGSILWIFQRIHSSFGAESAEVAVAFMSMLILSLILVGLRAGLGVDRFIRRRKLTACKFYRSSSQARYFLSLLGYEELQRECELPATLTIQNTQDTLALIERPRRRGRPPTHSLDRWTRVVLAWENRDPIRNPMTLVEFLSQEFGTYADGSPCMSENSFYENRKKVFDELRKDVTLKQKTSD